MIVQHIQNTALVKSSKTGSYYISKYDVFLSYQQNFFDIVQTSNQPIDEHVEWLLNDYRRAHCGAPEYVLLSEWNSVHSDISKRYGEEVGEKLKTPNLTVAEQVEIRCECLAEILFDVIDESPDVFLPCSLGIRPMYVRIFDDGTSSFAMTDELEYVISGAISERCPTDNWETVDSATALERVKGRNVELLESPVFRGFPVLTPNIPGQKLAFCSLASPFLRMIISKITEIFAKKYGTYQDELSEFVTKLQEHFPKDKKEFFFLTQEKMEMIWNEMTDFIETSGKSRQKDAVSPRNVAYFLRLFPDIAEFFHNQKECSWLVSCPLCPDNQKYKFMAPTFEQEAMEMLEELETMMVTSEVTTSEEDKESVEKTVKKKKKNKKKKNAKVVDSEVSEVAATLPEKSLTSLEPVESTSTCQKCFRTSEHCKKAKEELKTSQNSMKKMKKKLSEKELELDESKRRMQEEVETLKLQMEELKRDNEQQRLEIEQLKEENARLTGELTASGAPMAPEERRGIIFYMKDRMDELKEVMREAQLKADKLKFQKPEFEGLAESELCNFEIQFSAYSNALSETLQMIEANKKLSRSQVPTLPDCPKLSERFNLEYKKMLDEEAKELEKECTVCLEVIENNEQDFFTCPVCNKSSHLTCIEPWFQISNNCPTCRAQWN